jgi:hypothetical protein
MGESEIGSVVSGKGRDRLVDCTIIDVMPPAAQNSAATCNVIKMGLKSTVEILYQSQEQSYCHELHLYTE